MEICIEYFIDRLNEIKEQRRDKYEEINKNRALHIGCICDVLSETEMRIKNVEDLNKVKQIISLLRDLEGEYPEAQKAISETIELIEDKLKKQIEKIVERDIEEMRSCKEGTARILSEIKKIDQVIRRTEIILSQLKEAREKIKQGKIFEVIEILFDVERLRKIDKRDILEIEEKMKEAGKDFKLLISQVP